MKDEKYFDFAYLRTDEVFLLIYKQMKYFRNVFKENLKNYSMSNQLYLKQKFWPPVKFNYS